MQTDQALMMLDEPTLFPSVLPRDLRRIVAAQVAYQEAPAILAGAWWRQCRVIGCDHTEQRTETIPICFRCGFKLRMCRFHMHHWDWYGIIDLWCLCLPISPPPLPSAADLASAPFCIRCKKQSYVGTKYTCLGCHLGAFVCEPCRSHLEEVEFSCFCDGNDCDFAPPPSPEYD